MRDPALLRRLAGMRWTPPPRTADFEVCIAGDREVVDMAELTLKLGTALERITLELELPMPELGVRVDRRLADGTFEVRALGRTRLCGDLAVPSGQWWRQHRAAGPLGRSGVVSMPADLDAPMKAEDLLVRAAEAVAWSDPGDLDRLTDERVQSLLPPALDVTTDELPRWRDAVRGLLRARISPHALYGLSMDGARELVPSAPRLADELGRPPSGLRLGADLFASVRPADDGMSELQRQIAEVVEEIWTTRGVACTPTPDPVVDEDLAGWGFEVVLAGVVRAAGEIPDSAAPLREWIHPVTGLRVDTPRRDDAESVESMLAAQVSACLQEAAAEFVDLAWVEEYLDLHAERLAELVEVVRHRLPEDRLTEVFARIAGEGRTLRGPAVIERLLEAGDQPAIELVLDEAEQEAALGWAEDWLDVTGLVELARTAAPLARPPAWSVALGETSIAQLRAGDDGDAEASVLRLVDAAAGPSDGDGVLVVPLDLRPVVSELVRAQLPTLPVVTRHEPVDVQLDDECPE